MLYLAISILSSSMLSIVMRTSQGHIKSKIFMLSSNYLTCVILSSIYIHFNFYPNNPSSGQTLFMGCINGFFYVASLILSQYNIEKNGMVMQNVFSRVGGLVGPLFFSILLFSEIPNSFQIAGSVLSLVAIVVMNYTKDKEKAKYLIPLVVLFVTEAFGNSMAKVYKEIGHNALPDNFLLYTFGTAFLLTIIFSMARKEKPGLNELLFGMGIGVPNFFASKFLILALKEIPAVVVYPIRGVGTIAFVALIGLLVFKEKLSKRQWLAFGAILVSILLLNM